MSESSTSNYCTNYISALKDSILKGQPPTWTIYRLKLFTVASLSKQKKEEEGRRLNPDNAAVTLCKTMGTQRISAKSSTPKCFNCKPPKRRTTFLSVGALETRFSFSNYLSQADFVAAISAPPGSSCLLWGWEQPALSTQAPTTAIPYEYFPDGSTDTPGVLSRNCSCSFISI